MVADGPDVNRTFMTLFVPFYDIGLAGLSLCPSRPNLMPCMLLRDRIVQFRDEIRRTAAAHGARDVRVFGSVARGQEADASDVDFLVTLDAGRTLLDLARLEEQLERLLETRVDVVTESALREPIRATAIREAIPV